MVGIGGSAGGIAPCAELLAALPASAPLAVIIVMHLSPTHDSELAALFSHAAAIPVSEAREGDLLVAGRAYVIPPGSALVARGGRLHLEPRARRADPPSVIDRLFVSLAESYGERAAGVVLSGTGSDGTAGLGAIRGAGGYTLAQDTESAEHDGMPASAAKLGVVDRVLPPPALGAALAAWAIGKPQPAVPRPRRRAGAVGAATGTAPLEAIIGVLGSATGVDFSRYKRPTLERRIARRMEALHLNDLGAYLGRLKEDPAEVTNLYREVLIQVTEFFRDPESLEALRREVLLPLLKGRKPAEPLRIWVAGCATGEEAYSLAITALEASAEVGSTAPIQLFATDLSEAALATARAGVYGAAAVANVSPARLARFFRPAQGGHEVQPWLRALCVFARHDLTRDPPFSRLDLVSCRNVFIYLDDTLQQRVLRTFHYALKPGGCLALGPAETTTLARDLFVVRDRKHKLFTPSGARAVLPPLGGVTLPALRGSAGAPAAWDPSARSLAELERAAEQLYRVEHPSARIIINENLDVLHLQGATGQFLAEPAGEPTTRLLQLARPELRVTLGRLIRQAQRQGVRVRQARVPLRDGTRVPAVDITVLPLLLDEQRTRYCLVLLDRSVVGAAERRPEGKKGSRGAADDRGRIRALERELQETRDYLQSVIEMQEANQAEVRAAYEESLSSNEEFQSTNEELETTKEELQSMNEEISTLNEELLHRNAELSQSNADLQNIFASIDTPLVLVDRELRIRQFSPRATEVFGVAPTDLGAGLAAMSWTLAPSGLLDFCREVLAGAPTREVRVQGPGGHGFLFRISPYRIPGGGLAGVVLSLVDVDAMHQLLALSDAARRYSDAIIETVWQPLLVLDERHRVRRANEAFFRLFGVRPDTVIGQPLTEIMGGEWDVVALRQLLESAQAPEAGVREVELTRSFQGTGERILLLRAQRMVEPGQREGRLLLALDDVTDRRRLKEHLDRAAKVEALGTLAGGVAHDLNNQLTALLGFVELVESASSGAVERADDLAGVRRAAEHMAQTIRQLLAFGRRQLLQPRPLELNALVRTELKTLRQVLGEKIRLTLTTSDAPLWFRADPIQMEQVLLNLVFNARDAMPEGGRLDISTSVQEVDQAYLERHGIGSARPGPHVRLLVRDSGTGMDAATRARIFEPFFTTKPQGQGTGLGLASVYGIVKQSGGWIWVESAPGAGSSFSIDLPTVSAADIGAPPVAPTGKGAPPHATVLVVDDEPVVLRAVGRQLRSLGYEVLEAGSGGAALERLAQHRGAVDLLLSDVLMPGMNGPDLVRRVQALRPGTPVLLMSGYYGDDLPDSPSLALSVPLLRKPFTRDELAAAVAAALAVTSTER